MAKYQLITTTPEETMALGVRLAAFLSAGDIVCLFGDLGSGKTTLIKGLAQGLGVNPDEVNSPTYVLMQMYEGARLPLFHFDLYRLEEAHHIHGIGYEEFFYGQGISVVEWAERLGDLMPEGYLSIELRHQDHQRALTLKAVGDRYERVVKSLKLS